MKMYDLMFSVTETLQNGNERTKTVSVYSPSNDAVHIMKATALLREQKHYYKISYLHSAYREILMID